MAMRDGTGPRGMGPMSGRGMGVCNPRGVNRRDYRQGRRRNPGMGRGPGMGPRGCYWSDDSAYYNEPDYDKSTTDKEYLERERDLLQFRLDEVSEILGDTEEEE